jgi:intergrase/recombinase
VLPDLDLVTESKHQGSGRFLRETSNDREWVKGQVKEISKLTEQLLEKHQKTLRIFIKVLMQNKVLKAEALEKALLTEGVQLKELLSSYPAITDYSGQLEEFIESNNLI